MKIKLEQDEHMKQWTLQIGRLYISPWHQWGWARYRKGYNWVNFQIIHLEVECAPYKSLYEITIGLLGFCVCIEYLWKELPND